ncbi:uncharacterized protein LOC143293563 [Babylonia areolata]|uniref:uncharacterized protein LOC143293563 n=1 Tax=Babylonia areolata TaxID=304850 RepID=UPI003FD255E2
MMQGKKQMLKTLAFLLALWWGEWTVVVEGQDCVQDGPCKCTSSQGTIDLTPIQGSSSQAAFPDVPDASGSWKYSYSPCTPFTEGYGECSSVAVCQVDNYGTVTFPAGDVDSATFGTDSSGNTQVTYTHTDSTGIPRTTIVTLQCDQSGGADSLNVQGEDPINPGIYEMTLTSVHCCLSSGPGPTPSGGGGSSGLSVGSILCIVFVGVACVYIIAGVAVQKGVRKAAGKEMIPNYTFWSALPGLIKDGVLFTFSGCKGSRTYDKI